MEQPVDATTYAGRIVQIQSRRAADGVAAVNTAVRVRADAG
jgi:hypothetical protein